VKLKRGKSEGLQGEQVINPPLLLLEEEEVEEEGQSQDGTSF